MTTTRLPENIGPYRVLRPIARGGMAEVYEVANPNSGEHLALKLLVQTGGALARFNREYEAMIRLNHPNIVRVYHYGLFGRMPWLTMELVDGTPIQAYAKRCGRPGSEERTTETIRLAHDLALALDHIHVNGLIHRDLKSANVLVLPDGRVKLIDFGTARVADAWEEITREGEFIGTFAYASPEQLTDDTIDHRSDLYSFGVLLYRLATGKRPFEAKDLHELARQHVRMRPRPPRELVPALPPALESLILALLEKKRENRPQSGREVAEALEEVAGHPLYLPGHLDVDLSSERLVGREEQMAQLWRFLDGEGRLDGLQGSPGATPAAMAIVVGPQGSGRHRVIQALERSVRNRGWRPLTWILRRGVDELEAPTRMLLDLVRSFGSRAPARLEKHAEALRRAERAEHLPAAERLEILLSAGSAILAERALADDQPIVVFLRGLQEAGAMGFEAVVGLREALRKRNARVLFVADCLETADDPASPARKRLPDATRIHLPPMTVQEVAMLVGALVNRRPPPSAVARKIWQASGGLPTYVEEVVKRMVSRGLLRVRSRDTNRIEWALREELDVPVPDGAERWVIDQLAELPADRRRVLEALALAGGEAPTYVLAAALECRAVELGPALDDLAHRGWVVVDGDGDGSVVRWRLILAEQVVLEQLHPCRRRVLERLLIDQLSGQPAFAAQIHLLLELGRRDEALVRALDWAEGHLSANRPVTALQVLDKAMLHVDTGGIDPRIAARLHLAHVQALLLARPTDPRTSRSLARAMQLGEDLGDAFVAELHLVRARIQRIIGHYPNFRKHLMEAWELVEHAPPSALGATVADLLGWSNRVAGHVDDAATWHGRARRIAVQVASPSVRAHADVGVAGWQYCRGLLLESERTAVGAIAIFDEVGDTRGLSHALPVWAASLRQQGRFSEALEVLDQQVPAMRNAEAPSQYVRLLLAAAWCEVDMCRLGRAQEYVDELAATLRRGEHLDLRLEADIVWGRIQLMSGQIEDARHRLAQVHDRAQAAGLRVLAETARALLGEALWCSRQQNAAHEAFHGAIEALAQSGDVPATATACVACARVMAEVIDPDEIFAPVASFLEQQPAIILQLERTLARGRWLRARGRDAAPMFAEARLTLDRMREPLQATDRAALRLHPWARLARRQRD